MHVHLYGVVLFGHITLAIGSFIAASGMHLAMAQLRSAGTVTQMRGPARLLRNPVLSQAAPQARQPAGLG